MLETTVSEIESVTYEKCEVTAILEKGETHLMKSSAEEQKPKHENYSSDEETGPCCIHILNALQKNKALVAKAAAKNLRDQQVKESENNAVFQEISEEASTVETILSCSEYSPPSSSCAHDNFEDPTSAVPIVTNLEPERAEADSTTSSPSNDFVSPLQELLSSRPGELYIPSYRYPYHRKFSTEEITPPGRDIINTLVLDRNSNDYFVVQDFPNITVERIVTALQEVKQDDYQSKVDEKNNAESSAVPQNAVEEKDEKVLKGPGAPSSGKEKEVTEEADKQEKNEKEDKKNDGSKYQGGDKPE